MGAALIAISRTMGPSASSNTLNCSYATLLVQITATMLRTFLLGASWVSSWRSSPTPSVRLVHALHVVSYLISSFRLPATLIASSAPPLCPALDPLVVLGHRERAPTAGCGGWSVRRGRRSAPGDFPEASGWKRCWWVGREKLCGAEGRGGAAVSYRRSESVLSGCGRDQGELANAEVYSSRLIFMLSITWRIFSVRRRANRGTLAFHGLGWAGRHLKYHPAIQFISREPKNAMKLVQVALVILVVTWTATAGRANFSRLEKN